MRKLNTSDVFSLARIIRASGMRSELTSIIKNIDFNDELNVEDIGITSFIAIAESLGEKSAESAIYEFVGNIAEIKAAEVASMGLKDFVELLREIVVGNDLKDFFKYLSGILGKN